LGLLKTYCRCGTGYRIFFLQMQTELDNFLGMSTGAEPAAPATEGQKILMMTVRAADTGKAFGQITAIEILLNDLRDYRTEVTEFTHI